MTHPAADIAPTPLADEAPSGSITPLTLIRFLLGQRQAIVDIAACPQALAPAALLVLSAGFAREYDGEDLLHEPWHLLIPHVASLLTSFLLYALVRLTGIGRTEQLPGFFSGFPVFLRLYWMTAPLAWVYAIPFERWMSPFDATLWNLRLLGIVSVWRVVVMIRVIGVVYGAAPLWRVSTTVLLFGDAVMLTAIQFMPVPVLHLMGGVRMTDSERILQSTTLGLQLIGFPFLCVLLILTLIPTANPWTPMIVSRHSRLHASTWLMAAAAVLIWRFVLPVTQPEQQRRRMAEQMIVARDFPGAIRFMSKHHQADFPPHWSPPPYLTLRQPLPPINNVVEVLIQDTPAAWVREIFMEKFRRTIEHTMTRYSYKSDEQLSSTLRILDRLPAPEWLPDEPWHRDNVVEYLRGLPSDSHRSLSEADGVCLQRILEKLPQPVGSRDPSAEPPDPPSSEEAKDESYEPTNP